MCLSLLSLSLSPLLLQESSQFISLFDEVFGDIFDPFNTQVDRTETFTHSPDASLRNIKARDINIIFGFFGPETARTVLCRVCTGT